MMKKQTIDGYQDEAERNLEAYLALYRVSSAEMRRKMRRKVKDAPAASKIACEMKAALLYILDRIDGAESKV